MSENVEQLEAENETLRQQLVIVRGTVEMLQRQLAAERAKVERMETLYRKCREDLFTVSEAEPDEYAP